MPCPGYERRERGQCVRVRPRGVERVLCAEVVVGDVRTRRNRERAGRRQDADADADDDDDDGNKNRVDQGGFMGLSRILSNAVEGGECNFDDAAPPRQTRICNFGLR